MNMKKKILFLLNFLLIIAILAACSPIPNQEHKTTQMELKDLSIYFIDVGQADSILIKMKNMAMLIDAGNNDDGDMVVKYIRAQGVTRLDYVIGTHPHEDHIGGLDNVIKAFDIGKIVMPNASNTTKTYEEVLSAIAAKGLKLSLPTVGLTYMLGDASFTIYAPNAAKYEELNNYSIALKLTYKKTSYLFEGDAEDISEAEMIKLGYHLKADVLKVGHHGSNSSTTPAFLEAVKPTYAVISVGKDNDYGHPKPATLSKLTNAGAKILRTDEQGTIVATSDGSTIEFDKTPLP